MTNNNLDVYVYLCTCICIYRILERYKDHAIPLIVVGRDPVIVLKKKKWNFNGSPCSSVRGCSRDQD